MADTVSFTLDLPKELVARIKAVKPSWLADLTDEEYLSHVIARGNFDNYLQQLENANAAVTRLAADLNLHKKGNTASSKNTKLGQRPVSKASPNQPAEKSPTTPAI